MRKKIPIEVSARHIHLNQNDLEALFSKGYKLEKFKELSQPGEFAAKEIVNVEANGKILKSVRVLGPIRANTQIEISATDAFLLGVNIPFGNSGESVDSSTVKISGPAGEIEISRGVIIPLRHIHCNSDEAAKLGIKDRQLVSVSVSGPRALVFEKVLVRVSPDFCLSMHIDTDEGNAAGINKKETGFLVL